MAGASWIFMPLTALCSPVGASVVPVACLVGLVGGPVRAAPAEPTANRRLRRCGRARLPRGRPPCVLCMQTRTTSRAHVVNRASHRRHAPLRRRPACWSRNVFCRPRKARAVRAPPTGWPTPGCGAPRGGCRGDAQPERGRIVALERRREGKIWWLLPEEPGAGGRDRRVRGACTTPGCPCPTDFCVPSGLYVPWAVTAGAKPPQVVPIVPTTHSAAPGARRAHHPGRSTRTHAPAHAPTRPTVHPAAPHPPL